MASQAQANKAPATKRRKAKSPAVPAAPAEPAGGSGAGRPARPFSVVAIGASAGGLEALEQFLGNVPAGSDMAFVVIQHLDPDHKGMMPELLQRATAMPVTQARNRMPVAPGHVYVMPYRTMESVIDGVVITFNDIGLAKNLEAELRALADKGKEAT